ARPLRLRGPECAGGHEDLAHRVVLDPVLRAVLLLIGHRPIIRQGRWPMVSTGDLRAVMSAKKSLPLSSTTMKAGKSRTSIRQTASIPSSGYSITSTLVMHSCASF